MGFWLDFWVDFLVELCRAELAFLEGVWWICRSSALGLDVEALASDVEALVTDFVSDCFWVR